MRSLIRRFLRWAYSPFIKDDAANFSQELAWWVVTRLRAIGNDSTGPPELSLAQWNNLLSQIEEGMNSILDYNTVWAKSTKDKEAFELLAKYHKYI